jgi:hypothetical protein
MFCRPSTRICMMWGVDLVNSESGRASEARFGSGDGLVGTMLGGANENVE